MRLLRAQALHKERNYAAPFLVLFVARKFKNSLTKLKKQAIIILVRNQNPSSVLREKRILI